MPVSVLIYCNLLVAYIKFDDEQYRRIDARTKKQIQKVEGASIKHFHFENKKYHPFKNKQRDIINK